MEDEKTEERKQLFSGTEHLLIVLVAKSNTAIKNTQDFMVSLRRKNKEASFRIKRKIFTEDQHENGGISFSKVNVN